MAAALEEAAGALGHDDVPIGAVLVRDGAIVARARNERELAQDPTAHAEIIVLRRASEELRTRRLEGSTLYVTLEPCAMCAGALLLARVDRLVYGASDPRAGAAFSLYNIPQDPRLNHFVEIEPGVMAEDSAVLLNGFFERRRAVSDGGSG
ncbi:MAG TPA: tRNA adenosine(34) deaminase TadA [Actinomycetota bacterium]|nr:tRNA adenosine(34) deaminase TadA [Actinomycetota bacterium]